MKVINKKSSVVIGENPKLPAPEQLEYGELAVNYAADKETLAIKNSNNEIVTFKGQAYIDEAVENCLTGVTVNGNEATVSGGAATVSVDGSDIVIGDSITESGVEIIGSSSTVTEALETVVSKIAEDERVTAAALVELNDDIQEISASTEGSISNVTFNGVDATVSGGVASISADGGDILVGGSITAGTEGRTVAIIESSSTISGALQTLSDVVLDNEEVISSAIIGLNDSVSALSGQAGSKLERVSVNGNVLSTGNTAVTLDGSDVTVGEDIAYQGETIISGSSSISGALKTIVDDVIENEKAVSQALIDLSNEIGTIPSDGTEMKFGEDIVRSGVTVISSAQSITSGMNTMLNMIIDDERVTSSALTDLSDRLDNVVTSSTITSIVSMTQQAYDALSAKSNTTLYVIIN